MKNRVSLLINMLLCVCAQGAWAANAEVKFIQKSWDEGSSKVVNTTQHGEGDGLYNLKGQRVDQPTRKGIYIQNGKNS